MSTTIKRCLAYGGKRTRGWKLLLDLPPPPGGGRGETGEKMGWEETADRYWKWGERTRREAGEKIIMGCSQCPRMKGVGWGARKNPGKTRKDSCTGESRKHLMKKKNLVVCHGVSWLSGGILIRLSLALSFSLLPSVT